MKTKLSTSLCVLAIVLVSVTPCRAADKSADKADIGAVVGDVVVARPLCLAVTVFGMAFFVASLPIAAITRSVTRSSEALVAKPAKATFTRPLGDFDALSD